MGERLDGEKVEMEKWVRGNLNGEGIKWARG